MQITPLNSTVASANAPDAKFCEAVQKAPGLATNRPKTTKVGGSGGHKATSSDVRPDNASQGRSGERED